MEQPVSLLHFFEISSWSGSSLDFALYESAKGEALSEIVNDLTGKLIPL